MLCVQRILNITSSFDVNEMATQFLSNIKINVSFLCFTPSGDKINNEKTLQVTSIY